MWCAANYLPMLSSLDYVAVRVERAMLGRTLRITHSDAVVTTLTPRCKLRIGQRLVALGESSEIRSPFTCFHVLVVRVVLEHAMTACPYTNGFHGVTVMHVPCSSPFGET